MGVNAASEKQLELPVSQVCIREAILTIRVAKLPQFRLKINSQIFATHPRQLKKEVKKKTQMSKILKL